MRPAFAGLFELFQFQIGASQEENAGLPLHGGPTRSADHRVGPKYDSVAVPLPATRQEIERGKGAKTQDRRRRFGQRRGTGVRQQQNRATAKTSESELRVKFSG